MTRAIDTRSMTRGFTLVELLVVMGTILLLIALFVGVGRSVFDTSRNATAQSSIVALDTLMSRYISERGESLPPVAWTPDDSVASPLLYPIIDGRNFSANDSSSRLVEGRWSVFGDDGALVRVTDPTVDGPRMINTAGMMLNIFRQESLVRESAESLPTEMVRLYTPYDVGFATNNSAVPELPTPIDPWGRPYRFVHPAADGLIGEPGNPEEPLTVEEAIGPAGTYLPGSRWAFTDVRRNAVPTNSNPAAIQDLAELADSDGGQTPNQRPYWYSAGPDGDPSTTDDNVYTLKPVLLTGN